MSDHPIPDDLVAIARRIHMTRFEDADLCDCADDELLDADTLATLAEWADGALIDPTSWRRYDRAEITLLDETTLMEVVRPDWDPPPGEYRAVHLIHIDDIGPDTRPVTTIVERADQ